MTSNPPLLFGPYADITHGFSTDWDGARHARAPLPSLPSPGCYRAALRKSQNTVASAVPSCSARAGAEPASSVFQLSYFFHLSERIALVIANRDVHCHWIRKSRRRIADRREQCVALSPDSLDQCPKTHSVHHASEKKALCAWLRL